MKKNKMTKKLMEEFNEDFIDVGGVLDTTLSPIEKARDSLE